MATLEALRKKIESARDLQSVVKTMKGMAAARISQYRQAVESLADYMHTIELGLQIVLRQEPVELANPRSTAGEGLGVVIFGTDQGMVGRFNEIIVQHSIDTINELHVEREQRHILAVGLRLAGQLENSGQPLSGSFPVPGSLAGVTPLVREITLQLARWRTDQNVGRIVLFFNQPESGASYQPQTTRLLPLDLDWLAQLQQAEWPSRCLPTFTMAGPRLLSSLVQHYFFVAIYRACVDSLASENASRLASMQGAEKNIAERLETLHGQFNRQRQQAITEELLEVVAGSEALS